MHEKNEGTSFEFIPSVDLLDGKVVRLRQGKFDDVTVYDANPVELAERWRALGVGRIHVVDLAGARDGKAAESSVVKGMVATGAKIQIGGGIRDLRAAEQWLEQGVDRVVIGTAAIKDPGWVRSLASSAPESLVVSVDGRGGFVYTEGWLEKSQVSLEALLSEVESWGVLTFLVTDIAKDGMGDGPSLELLASLQKQLRGTIIASGGIRNAADVMALANRGLRAAVSGRAIHDKTLDLEALCRQLGYSPPVGQG